jgi:hypothetical protein
MIEMTTPMSEIDKFIADEIRKSEKDIIKKLSYIGEAAVNEARSNGDYIDRTGNLRTSVGYTILNDGKTVILSDFNKVKQESTEGKQTSLALINELKEKYNKGFVLIVVAGMDYAVYVEALGRNVLSSSKLLAESMSKRLL